LDPEEFHAWVPHDDVALLLLIFIQLEEHSSKLLN